MLLNYTTPYLNIKCCALFLIGFFITSNVAAQQIDNAFHAPVLLKQAEINTIKIQNDNSAYIGGDLDYFNYSKVGNIVHINADGTLNSSFNFEPDFKVQNLQFLDNGGLVTWNSRKVLVIDNKGTVIHTLAPTQQIFYVKVINNSIFVATKDIATDGAILKKYNIDFTVNKDFVAVAFDGFITDIAHYDGSLYVCGNFSKVNYDHKNDIVKLSPKGNVDKSFDTGQGTPETIGAISMDKNGKILVSNSFISSYNGNKSVNYRGVFRLNPDGSLDHTFQSPPIFTSRSGHALPIDNKVLISGPVMINEHYDGHYLMRLNPLGEIDEGFQIIELPEFYVLQMDNFSNNQVLANITCGNTNPFGLVKIAPDSKPVANFQPKIATIGQINSTDYRNSKIVIAGDFIEIDKHPTYHLAQLDRNGNVDKQFAINKNNGPVNKVKYDQSGKAIAVHNNKIKKYDGHGNMEPNFAPSHINFKDKINDLEISSQEKLIVASPSGIQVLDVNGKIEEKTIIDSKVGAITSTHMDIGLGTNGDIWFGSGFNSIEGKKATKIVKLDKTGAIDKNFSTNNGPNGNIERISPTPGTTFVVGWFDKYNNKDAPNGIVKFDNAGNYDSKFMAKFKSNLNFSRGFVLENSDGFLCLGQNNIGEYQGQLLFSDGATDTTLAKVTTGPKFQNIQDVLNINSDTLLIFGDIIDPQTNAKQKIARLLLWKRLYIASDNLPSEIDEDTQLSVSLQQLTLKNDHYGGASKLNILPGKNYTVSNNVIVPDKNFNGKLNVVLEVQNDKTTSFPYTKTIIVKPVNDPPTILGYNSDNTVMEDHTFVLDINNINVEDPDQTFPYGHHLIIKEGEFYTVSGNTITPIADYYGGLKVNIMVSDGTGTSNVFPLSINVLPINDKPVISSINKKLTVKTGEAFSLELTDISVSDPDNLFPQDFSMKVISGPHYSYYDGAIHPSAKFYGILPVQIRVNDGTDDSDVFGFNLFVGDESVVTNNAVQPSPDDWAIYPNPAKDRIYIKSATASGPATLLIYNQTGQLMHQGNLVQENENRIDITGWSRGIYIINIISGPTLLHRSKLLVE